MRNLRVPSSPSSLRGSPFPGLLRVVHPFPSVLVAAVTVALVPFADHGANAALYVQLGLGMLLYQFAIGAANDVVDAPEDVASKPSKPIPAGLISSRTAAVVAVLCSGAGLIVTAPMDLGPWLIGLAGLGCGLVYDVSLKRTPLSWLPLSLALPLVPVWVFTAAGAWDPLLWTAFPAGLLFGAAIHLANELPDIAAGSSSRGAAHLAGPRRAYLAALALFGAGTSLIAVVLAFVEPVQAVLVAAAGAMAFVLAPRATRLFGRSGLFGILATTAAVIAVVFVSAV